MKGWHEQVELLQNFWRWLHLPSLSHFVQGLVANFDNGRMAKRWMRSRHQPNEAPADDYERNSISRDTLLFKDRYVIWGNFRHEG